MQNKKRVRLESENHTENCGFPRIVKAENEDPSFSVSKERREHSSKQNPHTVFDLLFRQIEMKQDQIRRAEPTLSSCKTSTVGCELREREREETERGNFQRLKTVPQEKERACLLDLLLFWGVN